MNDREYYETKYRDGAVELHHTTQSQLGVGEPPFGIGIIVGRFLVRTKKMENPVKSLGVYFSQAGTPLGWIVHAFMFLEIRHHFGEADRSTPQSSRQVRETLD